MSKRTSKMSCKDIDSCFINCSRDDHLIEGSSARIKTIIQTSKERNDVVHFDLQESIDKTLEFTIKFHNSFVSTYTSKAHPEAPETKWWPCFQKWTQAKRRTRLPSFDFRKCCLILWWWMYSKGSKSSWQVAAHCTMQNYWTKAKTVTCVWRAWRWTCISGTASHCWGSGRSACYWCPVS